MTVMRLLVRLWAVAGGLMLGGRHYTEEEKWSVCCVLYIGRDDAMLSNFARVDPIPEGQLCHR